MEPRRLPRGPARPPGAPGSADRVDTQLPERGVTAKGPVALRTAPLPEAQESLRPVTELLWEADGLHLRLTAEGPWERETLLMLVASVRQAEFD